MLAAGRNPPSQTRRASTPEGLAFWLFGTNGTKKYRFFKNEPRKLLKTKDWRQKRTGNEAENEAEKLLKIHECIKNEPKRT
jgi:hypothetical protein